MISVTFIEGTPPTCGSYLVTDGEEVNVDSWWEFVERNGIFFARLSSDLGKPHDLPVITRWSKYENVIAYAPRVLK
jgi:hypothetical protein